MDSLAAVSDRIILPCVEAGKERKIGGIDCLLVDKGNIPFSLSDEGISCEKRVFSHDNAVHIRVIPFSSKSDEYLSDNCN